MLQPVLCSLRIYPASKVFSSSLVAELQQASSQFPWPGRSHPCSGRTHGETASHTHGHQAVHPHFAAWLMTCVCIPSAGCDISLLINSSCPPRCLSVPRRPLFILSNCFRFWQLSFNPCFCLSGARHLDGCADSQTDCLCCRLSFDFGFSLFLLL